MEREIGWTKPPQGPSSFFLTPKKHLLYKSMLMFIQTVKKALSLKLMTFSNMQIIRLPVKPLADLFCISEQCVWEGIR